LFRLCVFAIITVSSGVTFGQLERLELGRRLQRFELAWEDADAQSRAAAVPEMKKAVSNFFSLKLREAGQSLDAAWQVVRPVSSGTDLEKYLASRYPDISPVLADSTQTMLKVRLAQFYENAVLPTAETTLQLVLIRARDKKKKPFQTKTISLAQAASGFDWAIGKLPEGDFELTVGFLHGGKTLDFPTSVFTRIDELDARLSRIEESLQGAAGTMNDTVRATARDTVSLLRSMQKGDIQETIYPAAARLAMCEALLTSQGTLSETMSAAAKDSDIWVSLAVGRKSVPVRIAIPEANLTSMPILFLFHGAGGSENMFFETYGAGRVVKEGVSRGWIVVAPRQGIIGTALDINEMLGELEKIFSVDRSRVMLVGHSMGAVQVMRQCSLQPTLPIAAVALGGGGKMVNAKRVKSIRWFTGAGDQDFGRRGTMQLQQSLEGSGVDSRYVEYPDVEHMVIVQAAILDVFEFLDQTLAAKDRGGP